MRCSNCQKNNPRKNSKYCTNECRDEANKVKSQARRRIQSHVLPRETEAILGNYKEPLRKVKKGYGYMGTIAMNRDKTHVQCHVCGLFFKYLAPHLRIHQLNAESYRKRFGLAQSTGLLGESTREKRIAVARKNVKKHGLKEKFFRMHKQIKKGKVKPGRKGNRRTSWSLERRNREGICPDQLLARIKEAEHTLKHVPSRKEFIILFGGKYINPINTVFGSWGNAVRMAGFVPVDEQARKLMEPEKLLEYLRDFYNRHGRTPQSSDMKRGLLPTINTYLRHFGSLNNARKLAGIPTLEKRGRSYVEVPAP